MTDSGDEPVDASLDRWDTETGERSTPGPDGETSPPISHTPVPDLPTAEAEVIAMGVELLATLEHDTLTVKEAVDRVETITTDPRLTREVLDAAESAGAIERDGETVTPRRGTHVSFGADVVVREGEFDCRRCGTTLTEGHFLQLDSGELGAFGSSCIRKVTGRE